MDFVGFADGWRGPLTGATKPLDVNAVRGILPRGGTILGSSRTNPLKQDGGLDAVRSTLSDLGVDALIAIGGEDTLGVAAKLYDAGVNVVGVPKTIDNDLAATDVTFGFDTAVQIATDAIDRLHTTAESHKRTLVLEVMGRHAGWIALHSGMAGGRQRHPHPRAELRHGRGRRVGRGAVRAWVRADHRGRRGSGAQGRRDGAQGRRHRRVRARAALRHRRLAGARARDSAPGTRRAPRCSGTSSGAARRPRATACWPRGSASVRSMPSATVTSARWRRCGATTSCSCPLADAVAELKTVPPELYDEAKSFFG